MSDAQTLAEIQQRIARLPDPQRQAVETWAKSFREATKRDPNALLAFALVGAELSAS
jgi:hypothetical protein